MESPLHSLHQKLLEQATKNHFLIENIYKTKPVDIVAFIKKSPHPHAPTIYISGGIHGDEPAGSFAILKLLEEVYFNDAINWIIIPILNPTGLEQGTRENKEGFDLNRDYKTPQTKEVAAHLKWFEKYQNTVFDLSLCLHEDWETPGFYAYSILPLKHMKILDDIVQAVSKVSSLNLATEIEGLPASDGFIKHTNEEFQNIINKRDDWPEAFFLINRQKTPHFHFTFETPSEQSIDERSLIHCEAIKASIKSFLNNKQNNQNNAKRLGP